MLPETAQSVADGQSHAEKAEERAVLFARTGKHELKRGCFRGRVEGFFG